MKSLLILSALSALSAGNLSAVEWKNVYQLDDIPLPKNVPPEVGDLAFGPEGKLYLCLRRGDILVADPTPDPRQFQWSRFATGFHNGCGLWVPEPGKAVVSQMAELTEAVDTDRDGSADSYRCLTDAWGLSGNYHETNALWPDGKGGYWLAIGTASHNGPTFFHTRGEYSKFGRRGRNYSSVKHRGWVLHYDGQTGEVTPFCSGFRMHNGIYQDPDGRLWCSDNQGDWKATTPLYHLEKGNFYGHPSSLVWDEKWPRDKDPLLTYRNDLDAYNAHRTLPAVQIPHGELCRSGAGLIEIPRDGSFGKDFAGHLLLADNNGSRICRLMLEEVKGRYQGCVTFFVNGHGLRSGNNRLRFSPDGKSLYVGQTVRGWGKLAEGLQRITWKGGAPFDISSFELTSTGFRLTFTQDLPEDATKPETYTFTSCTYQSRWTYGSGKEDKQAHAVTSVRKTGSRTVELDLDGLAAGRVYELKLPKLASRDGSPLHNRLFCYTANQLR